MPTEFQTASTNLTTRDGIVPTFAAPLDNDSNYVDNARQRGILYVKNADAAAHVVHIISQVTVDGYAVKDIVQSIAASGGNDEYIFGPFNNTNWGSSGNVYFDVYDASGPTFDSDDVASGTKDVTGITAAWIVLGSI